MERLDSADPPAEPRLQAAVAELLTRGVTGKSLAALEDGYAALLDEQIDAARVEAGGEALFRAGAALLGADDAKLSEAGRLHAVASAARRGLMAIPDDVNTSSLAGYRFSRALRPLTGLARLAVRDVSHAPDLEPEATPARAVALISHRLFGTVA